MDKSESNTKAISELIEVVRKLRDPNHGCPWDRKQTHASLIPFVLEEAHEVADAIRENKSNNLCEELGDLLLQVILHAQIASERNDFNFEDITQGIIKKLIRRHPHVFEDPKQSTIKEVEIKWELIKNAEKKYNSNENQFTESIRQKIRSQPALFGSNYISRKVAKIGFEWNSIEEVWQKLEEEIQEFKDELNEGNEKYAEKEFGDIMFTIVNIARWCKINPEEALAGTNKRFLKRFSYIEKELKGKVEDQKFSTLEYLWQKAKAFLEKKN